MHCARCGEETDRRPHPTLDDCLAHLATRLAALERARSERRGHCAQRSTDTDGHAEALDRVLNTITRLAEGDLPPGVLRVWLRRLQSLAEVYESVSAEPGRRRSPPDDA